MVTHVTKRGNIGEVLYKTAELRLFTNDKSDRLFQCALAINGDTVKVTLGASFVESELSTMRDIKEVLQAMDFKVVEFERELGGRVRVINL